MHADEHLKPLFDALFQGRDVAILDAHTHIGCNDPDGFRCSAEENVAALELAGARGVVFPMHELAGYRAANDVILVAAEESEGRLIPFCRLDPHHDGAMVEGERALDAGARGIKLHPRAERFTLTDAEDVFAMAHERRVPVLIHAGRGIPALGEQTLEMEERFPAAPLILAHAGISDLAWIWRHLPDHPNVYFDTSWWNPVDLLTLSTLVPPGRILFGSDLPYGTAVLGAVLTARCAIQAGHGDEELAAMMGGQLERLLAGEKPLDLGPARGAGAIESDLLLDRVHNNLVNATGRVISGKSGEEPIALAKLACDVGAEAPQLPTCEAVLELLHLHDLVMEDLGREVPIFTDLHYLVAATCLARTPAAPLPQATA